MQVSALSTACKYGIAECREIAQKLFKSWMDDSSNKRQLCAPCTHHNHNATFIVNPTLWAPTPMSTKVPLCSVFFNCGVSVSIECRIHPNLRYTVYCYAIAAGGIGEWEFALNMYKNSSFSMEKAKLLSALACSKEPWILSRCAYSSISVVPSSVFSVVLDAYEKEHQVYWASSPFLIFPPKIAARLHLDWIVKYLAQ